MIREKTRTVISFFLTLFVLMGSLLSSMTAQAANPYGTDTDEKMTIKLLVVAIDPTLKSTDGKPYWNGEMEINASEYFGFSLEKNLQGWIDIFEEVSHNTVEFNVVGKEIIDEFPKYKSMDSLNNESFQEIFKKDESGYGDWFGGVSSEAFRPFDTAGDLDYYYYLDKLDLVNRRNQSEFDMIYMIGIDPLSPYETCMVGQAPFWVNGEAFVASCPNFVIVTPTFSRFDGSIENIGHLAEHMLGYTYGSVFYMEGYLDGSDYMSLNDWQKYALCKFIATPNTEIYGYGMVHFSPNSDSDYDWNNPNPVKYYRDWKNGSDIQDFLPEYMEKEPFAYNGDPCVSHHKWWFYNMPCEPGRDEKGYYKNWWKYIFTPDYVSYITACEGSGPDLYLKVGERTPIPFRVCYNSGLSYETNTVENPIVVTVSDPELLSVEDGNLCTLKNGVGTVQISMEGKEWKYIVHVDSAKEQGSSNKSFVWIIVGGVVFAIALITVVLVIVLKKHKGKKQ